MIKTFSGTDVGKKRKINQDYVYTSEQPVGNLENLFIVADGMGGHKAGGFASRFAVETMVEQVRKEEDIRDPFKIFDRAIRTTNKMLMERAAEDRELSGMGTTLVACTIMGNYFYTANVGDSRMYVCNRKLKQITRDHSLVEDMIRLGEIRPEDAKNHPDKNIITRAIGITKDVQVDYFDRRIRKNDVILMCTDGLTNMVDDETIFRTISSARDPVEITEELIRLANAGGGRDNIGIVVIKGRSSEVGL